MLRMFERINDAVPKREIGGLRCEVQFAAHDFVQPLFMQHLGNLVYRGGVVTGNHRSKIDIGEQRNLAAVLIRDRSVAATHHHVRLNTDFPQLLHAVLRRFGFDFPHRGEIWNEGQVDIAGIVPALLDTHLANRLKERQ